MVDITLGDLHDGGLSLMLQHIQDILTAFSKLRDEGFINPKEEVLILRGTFDYHSLCVLASRLPHEAKTVIAHDGKLGHYTVCWGGDSEKGIGKNARIDPQMIRE